MANHCMRCNREISDPNAAFGWRCAGNTDDISDALHTVAARRTKDGKYEIFNNNQNGNDSETKENLGRYIKSNRHIPLVMFCINE